MSVWMVSCGDDKSYEKRDAFKALSYKKQSAPTSDADAEKYDCNEVENLAYGASDHQKFDFYKPNVDTPQKRPLIVVLHPGGFVVGSKDDLITTQLSRDFCRRGFKVAAVNYRLIGMDWKSDWKALVTKTYTRTKIIEAVNDARQAIQYLNDQSDELGIDKENIFVVGFSAGAIIANHLVFSDKKEVDDYLHERELVTQKRNRKDHILPQDNPALAPVMPNTPAQMPTMAKLKGVIALGGGLMSAEHADDGDVARTPLLLIHGDKDKMVPNGTAKPFELIVKDQKLYYPGLCFKLGVIYGGNVDNADTKEITIQRGMLIPKKWIETLRNALTSEMCGSKSIFQKIKSGQNLQYIEIRNAPHNFMTDNQGVFNQTYVEVRREMMKFIRKRQFVNNFNLK